MDRQKGGRDRRERDRQKGERDRHAGRRDRQTDRQKGERDTQKGERDRQTGRRDRHKVRRETDIEHVNIKESFSPLLPLFRILPRAMLPLGIHSIYCIHTAYIYIVTQSY